MDATTRRERLLADHAALADLCVASDVLDMEPIAEPTGRYVLRFAGRGLGPVDVVGRPALVERHEVEICLPLGFPEQPPDIRWLSPLLHPNVSFSGLVNLAQIRLPWTPQTGLDVVCERLWDVARGAFFDLSAAANEGAKPWYEPTSPITLPLDDRPLRSRAAAETSNIVRYQRAGQRWQWPVANDILFIGEDSPLPEIALPQAAPAHATADEDVLYIGPE